MVRPGASPVPSRNTPARPTSRGSPAAKSRQETRTRTGSVNPPPRTTHRARRSDLSERWLRVRNGRGRPGRRRERRDARGTRRLGRRPGDRRNRHRRRDRGCRCGAEHRGAKGTYVHDAPPLRFSVPRRHPDHKHPPKGATQAIGGPPAWPTIVCADLSTSPIAPAVATATDDQSDGTITRGVRRRTKGHRPAPGPGLDVSPVQRHIKM